GHKPRQNGHGGDSRKSAGWVIKVERAVNRRKRIAEERQYPEAGRSDTRGKDRRGAGAVRYSVFMSHHLRLYLSSSIGHDLFSLLDFAADDVNRWATAHRGIFIEKC